MTGLDPITARKEFGDFQTPADLAREVWSNIDFDGTDLVVEPTIGLASFAQAAPPDACAVPWIAWDINPVYVSRAQEVFSERGIEGEVSVQDVFAIRSSGIPRSVEGRKVLIVGNPPWVTSSTQGGLTSTNLPRKWNRFGLRGLDALTGKANFDIAEAVVLAVAAALSSAASIRVALLVKRSVAMKLARDMLGQGGIADMRFTRIDAKRWFDASVEAGLVEFTIDRNARVGHSIELRTALGCQSSMRAGIAENGSFVEDIDAYAASGGVEALFEDGFEWRQGVKHDLTNVLELRQTDDGFVNGLGEDVDVEMEVLSPLYKSSDLARSRAPRRWMPLYQQDLSGPVPDIASRWPKLWRYLEQHRARFDARKSSIYRGKPSFMLFGVGPYSLAPYKVAISGFYPEPHFRVIGPSDSGSPPLVDDTCYLLPFEDFDSAQQIALYLNSNQVQAFLASVADRAAKRPYTKALLSRIRAPISAQDSEVLALF